MDEIELVTLAGLNELVVEEGASYIGTTKYPKIRYQQHRINGKRGNFYYAATSDMQYDEDKLFASHRQAHGRQKFGNDHVRSGIPENTAGFVYIFTRG